MCCLYFGFVSLSKIVLLSSNLPETGRKSKLRQILLNIINELDQSEKKLIQTFVILPLIALKFFKQRKEVFLPFLTFIYETWFGDGITVNAVRKNVFNYDCRKCRCENSCFFKLNVTNIYILIPDQQVCYDCGDLGF